MTAPEKIYLQWSGPDAENTWCVNRVDEGDVPDTEYIRADIVGFKLERNRMIWQPFKTKPAPTQKHVVLCAWHSGSHWDYAVMIHWPDGVWTDDRENEMDHRYALPLCWMEIPNVPRSEPYISLEKIGD